MDLQATNPSSFRSPSWARKLDVFDWLGLYRSELSRWERQGLAIERIDFKDRVEDPIAHRIQLSYDSVLAGRRLHGYGEAASELFAYEKAICELLEREAVFANAAGLSLTTSNGIAAHRFLPLAKDAARRELLERDAFIRHWLTRTPLLRVAMPRDPTIRAFERSLDATNHDLVLCQTYLGFIPTAVALIVNRSTQGFMLGSSATKNKLVAQRKAIGEAFFNLFCDRDPTIDWSVPSFMNHFKYWYRQRTLPAWLVSDDKREAPAPQGLQVEWQTLRTAPVPVVIARSAQVFQLWAGPTPPAVIAAAERQFRGPINLDLHPFP